MYKRDSGSACVRFDPEDRPQDDVEYDDDDDDDSAASR